MKYLRVYVGIFIASALFVDIASSQEQIPFIGDDVVPVPDLFPDPSLPTEDPVPPPIWSLCGDPSKHLLVPYPSLPSPTYLTPFNSDKNGVTIDPEQPMVG